jgi:hypothetical protein
VAVDPHPIRIANPSIMKTREILLLGIYRAPSGKIEVAKSLRNMILEVSRFGMRTS